MENIWYYFTSIDDDVAMQYRCVHRVHRSASKTTEEDATAEGDEQSPTRPPCKSQTVDVYAKFDATLQRLDVVASVCCISGCPNVNQEDLYTYRSHL